MNSAVTLTQVSKRFTIEHDKPRSFQEMLVTAFRRSSTREEFWALRDVSLTIPHGQTVGLIGANGSGKSTILKLIARILHPTAGRVQINGRTAALLELGAGFHSDLSGRENILLNGLLLGMTRREIRQRLAQIVDFAELERFIDTPLRHYSSGMYMRLAFAVAVHSQPEILLIDEILAVGDEDFQQKCFARIRALQQAGVTVLLVSHNTGTLSQLCDTLVLLHAGSVAAQGRPDEVIHAYHQLLQAHDPAFRPLDGAVAPPSSAVQPVGSGEELARVDAPGAAVPSRAVEAARILRMQMSNEAGQAVQELSTGQVASLVATVAFSHRVENPIFGFRVRRQIEQRMVDVYTTCTAWQGIQITGTFEPGQTIDVEFRQRLVLGEGDYLFDATVLSADMPLAFNEQTRPLSCKIIGGGQMQGIVDLHSAIAVQSLIPRGRTL